MTLLRPLDPELVLQAAARCAQAKFVDHTFVRRGTPSPKNIRKAFVKSVVFDVECNSDKHGQELNAFRVRVLRTLLEARVATILASALAGSSEL